MCFPSVRQKLSHVLGGMLKAKIGQSMWLAAVLGGIAVPFNYMVGAGLGAVSLPLGEMLSVAVLVAIWLGLLPLLYRISHRMAPAA